MLHNGANHVTAPGEDRDFASDKPALEHAAELADGHAIDVWQGRRFIGTEGAQSKRAASDFGASFLNLDSSK